jgi:hypothetical protein
VADICTEKSDAELAGLCLAGDKDAWEEFYRRFDELITRTIERVFLLNGFDNVGETFVEIQVSEIHLKIVSRFKRNNLLESCVDPTGLRLWLKTVARNEAVTRLIRLGRQKYLPDTVSETTKDYLDRPFGEDKEETFGDTISANERSVLEILIAFEKLNDTKAAMEEMEREPNRQQYWLLRLDIMAVLPFDPDEIETLVQISPLSEDDVRETMSRISREVAEEELKREAALGRAEVLRRRIERLQTRLRGTLSDKERDMGMQIKDLQDEISVIAARRHELLREGEKIPHPAQKDMGALVGMSDDQVSTNLNRVRNKVRSRVRKRIEDKEKSIRMGEIYENG